MRRGKKKKRIFNKLLSLILLILSIFFIINLVYLNILTNKYLLIIIIFTLILNVVLFLISLKGKKKIGTILVSIFILIFSLINFYLTKTNNLLSDLNLDYKTYNYSVVVLNNSDYKKLNDLNDKKLGYYNDDNNDNNNDNNNDKNALNKVLKKVEIETFEFDDTNELANKLLSEEVDAILLEDSYLDMLDESIAIDDLSFSSSIRKIYSFSIKESTSDISKDINVVKNPFTIYISGIDTYGEISNVSRSDVNMLATINPSTKQILLTSIPRDYYVSLHGKSGYKDKLTHAGLYGTDMSIQTIEDLLDIEINYYVKVNFSSVIDIVNAIGGVTVYSDYTFTSIDGYKYEKGYNEVNGEQALSFARERKSFATGDRQRGRNQQALLKAMFDKCTSKAIITKYSKLLDSISGSFVTNMKTSRLTSLIKYQLANNFSWNIVTNSLNGSDASNYTYSAPSTKAYVMEASEKSVEYASDLIKQVINGEILDKEEIDASSTTANKVTSTPTINNDKDTTSDKEEVKEDVKNTGLEIKLKDNVEFYLGEEFIYYGYTLKYNEEEISNKANIKEEFKINDKVYDNYQDLVFYISNKLDSGEYKITYTITYKDETVSAIQNVVIKESISENEKENDNKYENNNKHENNDDNSLIEDVDDNDIKEDNED